MDVIALMIGFVIAVGGTFLSLTIAHTIFSPVGIYSLVWGIVILLFSIHSLIGFDYVGIRLEIWLLVFLGWFTYILGCLTVMFSIQKGSDNSFPSTSVPGRIGNWMRLLTFIGSFGVMLKWIILMRSFGNLLQVISNLGNIRLQMLEEEFTFPVAVDFMVFFLFPSLIFAYILTVKNARYFRWVTIIVALLFLNDFALAGRGTTMHGFFMVLSAYFLTNLDTISRSSEIRKLLKFAIGGVLLILLLYVSVIIRENLTGLSPWGYVREAFRGFYLYITGPLVAFSQIFEIGSLSKYFGAYTFGGIYRLINILGNVIGLSDMFESPPKPYMFIPQPFNTYPHLWFFYSDFGFAGTLITMWIMGWFFSYIYLKYRLRKTLSLLIVNILLFDYLLITPRDTATFWISFWFTLALSWFSAKCVEQRTRVRSNCGGNYAHNS